ncbi:MAG: DUF4115 domain-containing protein [Sedimenticola sp.]|nr:DUF4115 domain-containing protein [Sedimenticola sp.]
MNAADTNPEETKAVIEGPGKQLRDIRMAKELDVNRVAGLLHLNVSMLKALEADDFSELPGTVFVQGYLKNYARLLDTPVEPILDAFHHFRPEVEEKMDLKAAQVKHEVRSSHTVVRLFTWLIVIGIIALVVTWWRGYLQWPIDLGLESTATAVQQQEEPVRDEMQPGQMNGSMPLPALLGKPEILDAPVAESSESVDSAESVELAETTVASVETETSEVSSSEQAERVSQPVENESTQSDIPAVAEETVAVTEPDTAAVPVSEPATLTKVEVQFADACWADIKDASGLFRLAGNKAAGERYALGGEPPYTMVFGNAAAVTLLVNGEAFDLAPHTRGNVARLTLNP